MAAKIATCCYCGTRAALVFDKGRHELTCSACGAPLHEMKMMPQPAERRAKKVNSAPVAKQSRPRPSKPQERRNDWHDRPSKKRHKKKRKPIMGRVFEELWDVVEDIFD